MACVTSVARELAASKAKKESEQHAASEEAQRGALAGILDVEASHAVRLHLDAAHIFEEHFSYYEESTIIVVIHLR